MSEDVITLSGLTRRFAGMDRPAVAPLDCTIHSGYVTGLVGPDGAGKTTLMRMLAGLLKPDAGSATVIGYDPIADDSALHAVLGYMPQKFGLYEDLTVMENLTLYADLRSVTGEAREKNLRQAAGIYLPRPLYRPAGGQAFRRHEAETWSGLHPGRRTESPATGRTRRRRRPHLAANCGRWCTNWRATEC